MSFLCFRNSIDIGIQSILFVNTNADKGSAVGPSFYWTYVDLYLNNYQNNTYGSNIDAINANNVNEYQIMYTNPGQTIYTANNFGGF